MTIYEYVANTVKVTDPAGRWKKYTMDGFGNLVKVEEPKPAGGTYITNYTYNQYNKLLTVSMTRDGYNGNTATTITQTRTFVYDAAQRLQSTTFPETPGSTTYAYNTDGTLLTKTDYKGVRKYFYSAAKQLSPGGEISGRRGRRCQCAGLLLLRFASTDDGFRGAVHAGTVGGDGVWRSLRVLQLHARRQADEKAAGERRREAGGQLRVRFRSQTAVYGVSERCAREVHVRRSGASYGIEKCAGLDRDRHREQPDVRRGGRTEIDVVVGKHGVGDADLGIQQPAADDGHTLIRRTGSSINHSYLYSTTANDGKLWRRQDNVSGEVVEYQYDSIHRLASAGTVAGTAWSQSYRYDGFGNMKQKIGDGACVVDELQYFVEFGDEWGFAFGRSGRYRQSDSDRAEWRNLQVCAG